MAPAAREAGVPIVTGDTKVVEQGKGDGVFINTTGVGVVPDGVDVSGDRARPGDAILVSGTMGDHGVAIMSLREDLTFETDHPVRHRAAAHAGGGDARARCPTIHCLRDPTRGGLATTLNEIARQSRRGMRSRRRAIPVRAEVRGSLRVPGPRPALRRQRGQARRDLRAAMTPTRLLAAMRAHPLGPRGGDHRRGGARTRTTSCRCETGFGGRRMVDWLAGEQLPRIC